MPRTVSPTRSGQYRCAGKTRPYRLQPCSRDVTSHELSPHRRSVSPPAHGAEVAARGAMMPAIHFLRAAHQFSSYQPAAAMSIAGRWGAACRTRPRERSAIDMPSSRQRLSARGDLRSAGRRRRITFESKPSRPHFRPRERLRGYRTRHWPIAIISCR